MGLKPISITEALRITEPRQAYQRSRNINRFENLRYARDSSPEQWSRDRSNSVKRKAPEEQQDLPSQPLKRPNNSQVSPLPSEDVSTLIKMEKHVDKTKEMLQAVGEELTTAKIDSGLESILRTIIECLGNTVLTQAELISSIRATSRKPESSGTLMATKPTIEVYSCPDNSDSEGESTQTQSYSQAASSGRSRPLKVNTLQQLPRQSSPADPKVKRFQEAVEEAERSTLIFNLNMGTSKILNEKTILTKAALGLMSAAAATEGKVDGKPSEDAIAALDDVFSIAQKATLYGRATKPVKARNGNAGGLYCTIPVRYDFKDRESRVAAESVLRERCKVDCSTPYPAILRACIKQVVEHIKADYQGEFVRVTVDANRFGLRAARKTTDGWALKH